LFPDKFAKCRKPDESLRSQVSELKKILVRREEINMKQKQLFRMLAADVQKKLDKASVDTRNLSEELKNLKGNISNQQNTSKSDSEYHGNIEFPIKSEYVRSGLTFLSAFLISFLNFIFCSREY